MKRTNLDPTPSSRPMSARQYRQMKEIDKYYINSKTIGKYDQRPWSGLLKRGWIEFNGLNWLWTTAGYEAMGLYSNAGIERKTYSDVLGGYIQHYLDVKASARRKGKAA